MSSNTAVDKSLEEFRANLVDFVNKRVESYEAAEDITQDVLEKFERAKSNVDSPSAWIYTAARNSIVDHYRKRRPAEPLPQNLLDNTKSNGPNQSTQELAGCLRPLINKLPNKYMRALTLVDLEGYTQEAASYKENISLSGMKSRVQRGRHKLGDLISQCCEVTLTPDRQIDSFEQKQNRIC